VSPRATEVNLGDRVFRWVTAIFAGSILVILGGMAIQMLRASGPSLAKFGFGFLTSTEWDVVHEEFGALPFIFGTVVSSLVGLVVAVPVALGIAIFLSELAPRWLARPLGFVVELLAAIPSVVYGLWGIFVVAPWLRTTVEPFLGKTFGFIPLFSGPPRGYGMLAAGFLLAIMILPTIASISRDVLRAAPAILREGALALGATRWEAIRLALFCGRTGVIGAVMLGLGRALGETMAVTMVIGNSPRISASVFAPQYTMAAVIANEFTEAADALYLDALVEIGLVLFIITVAINALSRLLIWRVGAEAPGRAAPRAVPAAG